MTDPKKPPTEPLVEIVHSWDLRFIMVALIAGVIVGGLVIAFVLSGEDTDHAG